MEIESHTFSLLTLAAVAEEVNGVAWAVDELRLGSRDLSEYDGPWPRRQALY